MSKNKQLIRNQRLRDQVAAQRANPQLFGGSVSGKSTSIGELYLERLSRLRGGSPDTGPSVVTPGPSVVTPGHSVPVADRDQTSPQVPDTAVVDSKNQRQLIWEEAKKNKEHYEQRAKADGNKHPWFYYVKKTTQYGEFIFLTPEMAEELLKYNPDNRNQKPTLIDAYKRDIENGNWIPSHEGIGINLSRNMMDGQHRCVAIVEANKPWPIWVVFNVLNEAKFVADSGAKRSVNEKMAMVVDAKLGNRTAGMVKSMMRGTLNRIRYSESEVVAFAAKYQNVIDWVSENLPTQRADVQGAIGKAYLWFGDEKLKGFCERIRHLQFSGDGDPAKALYVYLQRAKVAKRQSPIEAYKKTVAAINALVENRNTAKLYESDVDIFTWAPDWEVPDDAPVNAEA